MKYTASAPSGQALVSNLTSQRDCPPGRSLPPSVSMESLFFSKTQFTISFPPLPHHVRSLLDLSTMS